MRSCSLAVYNNEFILCSPKITETTKSLKICCFVFILRLYIDKLKWHINSEWAALSHAVIERAVDKSRKRLQLVFVLEADI